LQLVDRLRIGRIRHRDVEELELLRERNEVVRLRECGRHELEHRERHVDQIDLDDGDTELLRQHVNQLGLADELELDERLAERATPALLLDERLTKRVFADRAGLDQHRPQALARHDYGDTTVA
jgi:hypothetical protein